MGGRTSGSAHARSNPPARDAVRRAHRVPRSGGSIGDTPGRGGPVDQAERDALIEHYRSGTADVENALTGLSDADLDRQPADPDELTARKIAHHLADSETMAYIRLRRLLAEDSPVIAGYDEPEWARR